MKKAFIFLIALSLMFSGIAEASALNSAMAISSPEKIRKFKRYQKRYYARKSKSQPIPVAAPAQQLVNASPVPVPTPVQIASVLSPDALVTAPAPRKQQLEDETLSGSIVVDVSENDNTVVKIGLADRAVTLIDFPVDDPVYKIHPGNENFVTVGCVGREPNGKCLNSPTDAIVLRPGKDFHALGDQESVATVISIQRVSGIVVTFIVVPVKSVSQNTNYVAVRYGLKDVLAARRNSGLAVNMIPEGAMQRTAVRNTETIPQTTGEQSTEQSTDSKQTQILDASLIENGSVKVAENSPVADESNEATVEDLLSSEIQRVAETNSALKFSKPLYGISLARATGTFARVKDVSVEVIAIRNTLSYPIRLVPDQPDLAIENRDSKDVSINSQKVSILHISTTADDTEVLLPGRIYYYAFAFQTPILGVRQSLRASFAQREAADAPAAVHLGGAVR